MLNTLTENHNVHSHPNKMRVNLKYHKSQIVIFMRVQLIK